MPLSDTLRKIRESPTPANEETAKMRILVPILRELGWDSLDQDVQWEYQLSRNRGRVDAALMGSKGPAAFIEAKAPGQRLNDHVEQVLGYAFQEGANICALTTGLEWWLYLPSETEYLFDERRFAELSLKDDPVEQLATDFAAFLGREPLLDGGAEKKAKQVLKARREAEHLDKEIPGVWSEMLAAPDEELIELVSKRVYEKTNLRPTPQQVTFALRGSNQMSDSLPRPKPSPKMEPKPSPKRERKQSQRAPKPTKIILWDQEQTIRNNADVVRRVIDALVAKGETNFEDTGISGTTHNPQRKFSSYYQAGTTGIYFSTDKNAPALKEDTYRLLEHFNYDRSDLEILFD